MNWSKIVREERDRRGMTLHDFAVKCVGCKPLQIWRWEKGISIPSPHFKDVLEDLQKRSVS